MPITKEQLKNAYFDYVNELYREIHRGIHEKAKHGPNCTIYTTDVNKVNKIVVEKLVEKLKEVYIDSKIELKNRTFLYVDSELEDDPAYSHYEITIDWS